MEKKVLVPVAQGIEELETIAVVDVLRRAGAKVTLASVDESTIHASKGVVFMADALIRDCVEIPYDLIVLPGGIPGAENLKNSKELETVLKRQAGAGKLYAAICASPAVVLYHHGLLKAGQGTCHPGFAKIIDNGNILNEAVVVNGNCITSQGAGTAITFALTLVECLYDKSRRDEVAMGMALVL